MNRVAVLGAGAWGTAFTTLLAENGFEVMLWCYEKEVVASINTQRRNTRYLPTVVLDRRIVATASFEEALHNTQWVFEVIPVKYLRATLTHAVPYVRDDHRWVILSKGIEQETLRLPSDVLDDVFGREIQKAVVAGPNFARDFAERSYTATTVACKDDALGNDLSDILANHYFRPYLSRDVTGVQVGGALKNVVTLLVGVARGAGFKDNTACYLITRGLSEMAELTHYYGGCRETMYGLSGLGDLMLTSMGSLSRNLKVGMLIGEGKGLDEALAISGIVPEGINTVVSVHELIKRAGLNLPICSGTYDIVFGERSVRGLLDELMAQPVCHECI